MGLSLARELAARGAAVIVLERGSTSGEAAGGAASPAALGVLSVPKSSRGAFGRLQLLGLRRYPDLARSLLDETGIDIGYRAIGALHLRREAPGAAARAELEAAYRGAGSAARFLLDEELREVAPALPRSFRAALHVAGEAVVSPPDLVRALAASCRRRGVALREGAGEARIAGGPDLRIELPGGETIRAGAWVVAAGAWSPAACGVLRSASLLPVAPVRGQALEVRCPWSSGPCLRFESERLGREYYIVPRGGGLAWVGSTVEDVGFDAAVTAAGVEELLLALREVFPGAGAADVVRAWSGLRPKALRPGGPFLGPLPDAPGVWAACGHYRSGILTGPASAELLATRLAPREGERRTLEAGLEDGASAGGEMADLLRAFAPGKARAH